MGNLQTSNYHKSLKPIIVEHNVFGIIFTTIWLMGAYHNPSVLPVVSNASHQNVCFNFYADNLVFHIPHSIAPQMELEQNMIREDDADTLWLIMENKSHSFTECITTYYANVCRVVCAFYYFYSMIIHGKC